MPSGTVIALFDIDRRHVISQMNRGASPRPVEVVVLARLHGTDGRARRHLQHQIGGVRKGISRLFHPGQVEPDVAAFFDFGFLEGKRHVVGAADRQLVLVSSYAELNGAVSAPGHPRPQARRQGRWLPQFYEHTKRAFLLLPGRDAVLCDFIRPATAREVRVAAQRDSDRFRRFRRRSGTVPLLPRRVTAGKREACNNRGHK